MAEGVERDLLVEVWRTFQSLQTAAN
jgi:hypothetical protein